MLGAGNRRKAWSREASMGIDGGPNGYNKREGGVYGQSPSMTDRRRGLEPKAQAERRKKEEFGSGISVMKVDRASSVAQTRALR